MVGATRVMRLAGALEKALHESRSTETVEGILRKLSLAFVSLAEDAKQLLRDAPAALTAVPPNPG
jgi:hypothetical protein